MKKKQRLCKWLDENKEKLLCNKEDTKYLERQFTTIDEMNNTLECCAKNKSKVSQFIHVPVPTYS
jgi:hypothetical protein